MSDVDTRPWGTAKDFASDAEWCPTLPEWCENQCLNTDCPNEEIDACTALCVEHTGEEWRRYQAELEDSDDEHP